MALGRNRDYKTRSQSIRKNLKRHQERMEELIALGYLKSEASKIAFDEIVGYKS